MNNMRNLSKHGQATIEFTFAMVVVALIIFGLIKTLRWAGMDYAEHSWDRERRLPIITTEDGKVDPDKSIRTKRLNAFTRAF